MRIIAYIKRNHIVTRASMMVGIKNVVVLTRR